MLLTYLIFICCLLLYYIQFNRRPVTPPGPLHFPFVGSLPFIGFNGHQSFLKLSNKYGPVVYLKIGTTWTVVLNSYSVIEETLIKQSWKFLGRMNNFFTDFVADGSRGIFYLDDKEIWKNYKKMTSKQILCFPNRIQIEENVKDEMKRFLRILKKSKESPIDVEQDLTLSMASIISKLMTSSRVEKRTNPELYNFILEACTRDKASFISLIYTIPWVRYFPIFRTCLREIKSSVERGSNAIEDMINQHEKCLDPNNLNNFLDHFLFRMKRDPKKFDKRQLRQFLIDMFIAGTETTTSTIRWFLITMVKFPDIQKKIHEEIDNLIGSNIHSFFKHDLQLLTSLGRNGTVAKSLDLPYTKAAIQEIFRQRTVVPLGIAHKATENAYVCGYFIPKGTQIVPNLWAVHNDPNFWKNPSKFKPERHLDENGKFFTSKRIIPFSVGGRRCLGASLSQIEVYMFVIGILQKFKILPDLNDTFLDDEVPGFINSPLSCNFIFKKR